MPIIFDEDTPCIDISDLIAKGFTELQREKEFNHLERVLKELEEWFNEN